MERDLVKKKFDEGRGHFKSRRSRGTEFVEFGAATLSILGVQSKIVNWR